MTLLAYLNGSDKAHKVRLGRLGLTSKADGSAGFGNIVFDDPDGTLEIQGWMHVVVKETDCTDAPCIYAGYVADRRYSRGSADGTYMTGVSRFIDTTLVDLNTLLHFQAMFAAEANRPAESEFDRINWLLSSQYVQGIVDDGLVNSSDGRQLDKSDFRGQYPDDVMSSLINTWIFFVYLLQPDGDPALFYNTPTASTGTSTLSISNDLDDITFDETGVTSDTFPSSIEAEMELDPSEVYARIGLDWVGGREIQTDTDTYETFFQPSGLGYRSLAYQTDRVKSAATAASYVARMLGRASTENETITDTISVPASKVGLLQAGNRLLTKYLHFGDTDFVYRRTTGIEIHQHPGRNDWYDITVELNSKGSGGIGGGGGDPGDFPAPPPVTGPCGEGTIQLNIASNTDSSPETFTVASGQYVYILAITRNVTFAGTSVWDFWFDSAVSLTPTTAGSGTPHPLESFDMGNPLGGPTSTGTWSAYEYDPPTSMHAVARGTAPESGPWVVDNTNPTPLYLGYWDAAGGGGYVIDPGTYHLRAGNLLDGYFAASGYAGSVCVLVSDTPPSEFLTPPTSDEVIPTPAQPFGPVTPVETPDGTIYTFTLPDGYTFADFSLKVFVNRLDQTAAVTSYDGECGVFTLAFAPWGTDVIEVYGVGR